MSLTVAAVVSLGLATGTASANETSCLNAAAANGYINADKLPWQVEQDCKVAYSIAYPGNITTQEEAKAAREAAEQYLRSRGYDADTVQQMDVAGHGV